MKPADRGGPALRVMPFTQQENVLTCPLVICGVTTMRFRVRRFAHVLERLGLAMAGAASGLFVAALVGSSFALLTSQAFLLFMMMGGAVGFYLGIDTPALPFHPANSPRSNVGTEAGNRFRGIPERGGHVSRDVLGFCFGQRDCAPPRSAHRLDNSDHGGMGRWRGHASNRRSDCTHPPLRCGPGRISPMGASVSDMFKRLSVMIRAVESCQGFSRFGSIDRNL